MKLPRLWRNRYGRTPAKMSRRAFAAVSAALAVVLAMGAAAPVAYADALVTNEDELQAAVKAAPADGSETLITIGADLSLKKTLSIEAGQNIHLTDDGHARTVQVEMFDVRQFITAAKGSTLTVSTSSDDDSLLVFDGIQGGVNGVGRCEFVNSEGAVHWMSGTITKWGFGGASHDGLLTVRGVDASMVIDGGLFANNKGGRMGGILNVYGGASCTMNSGTITENRCDDYPNDGSPIYISALHSSREHPSTFVMNGGTVAHNVAGMGGGLFVGTGLFDYNKSPDGMAIATMNAGTIAENRGNYLGGGVAVIMAGDFTLNGGSIVNNYTKASDRTPDQQPNGGGVAVWDGWVGKYAAAYANAGMSPEEIHEQWLNQWSKEVPARFVMNGGEIRGNKAKSSGGGVFAGSAAVELRAGKIEDNSADSCGGGVYVTAHLYETHIAAGVVTGNSAELSGGGIWMCPKGSLATEPNSAAGIFGNTANGAGSDFVSLSKDLPDFKVFLSDRMLGGGRAFWYDDGRVTRADADDQYGSFDPDSPRYMGNGSEQLYEGPVTDSTRNLALINDAPDAMRELATASGKVIIKGNTAAYGGGIAVNGHLVLGQPDQALRINVKKVWDDGNNAASMRPQSVGVMLLRDGMPIDAIILSEQNGWEYTFNNLPAHLDGDLSTLATYTVAEEAPEGYTSTITGNPADGFVITNTPELPPAPEPGPAPDPQPEPKPGPQPGPEPTPQPEPSPNPTPEPSPNPMPEPSPQPEPSPAPKPEADSGKQSASHSKSAKKQETLPQTGDQSALMVGCAAASMAILAIGCIAMRKRQR